MTLVWTVHGTNAEDGILLEGVPLGDHIKEQEFAIDWRLPPSKAHPDWPVRIVPTKTPVVTCHSGVSGLDKYMYISDVRVAGNVVLFKGSLFSYARNIELRAVVNAEMCNPNNGNWYALDPVDVFHCKNLVLGVVPGPEKPNPPWVQPPENSVLVEARFAGPRVDILVDQPIVVIQQRAKYYEPIDEVGEVSIKRVKDFHPHATEDLFPRIKATLLKDGSGIVLQLSNLRPYERYIVTALGQTIYVRTLGK